MYSTPFDSGYNFGPLDFCAIHLHLYGFLITHILCEFDFLDVVSHRGFHKLPINVISITYKFRLDCAGFVTSADFHGVNHFCVSLWGYIYDMLCTQASNHILLYPSSLDVVGNGRSVRHIRRVSYTLSGGCHIFMDQNDGSYFCFCTV